MKIISFVVDALAEHYFKAELLLFSLEKFAHHPKEHILVQCVNRVDESFLNFLQKHDYRSCIIEPYLDGKYCNKIQQLDALEKIESEGVFLLDVDMFALAPLSVEDDDFFSAKIVDMSNPPLSVLKKIYKESGVPLPEVVGTDVITADGETLTTNFNGGFYYIPYRHLRELNRYWKKWATWLYDRQELFDTEKQRIHIDQVSMGLSLIDAGIDFKRLSSNNNFPTNGRGKLRYLQPEQEIRVLHYHNLMTPFGTLKERNNGNGFGVMAIRKANEAIAEQKNFEFFDAYKRKNTVTLKATEEPSRFSEKITSLFPQRKHRIKLVLHAGTTKTGTTSLQFFMDQNREALLKNGVLYPDNYSATPEPKHQWLVSHLLNENFNALLNEFETLSKNVENETHTIFISTEGIFNHWWDFSDDAKSVIKVLTANFDVSLWVWFRDPLTFADSLYRQYIKNPQMKIAQCYGRDLSFEEILNDDWFCRHFDYLGFVYECESVLGQGAVEAIQYDGDIIPIVCNKLDIPDLPKSQEFRENTRLCTASIEILRVVNRYPLKSEEKKHVVTYVEKLNEILEPYSQETIITNEAKNKITNLVSLGKSALDKLMKRH